uniref:DB domain-containing protein n=1 Tax=Mesocestoides corti TaxID=53468 RepID=A0A5K3FDD3_MESCO
GACTQHGIPPFCLTLKCCKLVQREICNSLSKFCCQRRVVIKTLSKNNTFVKYY